ncbi:MULTISPECIES: hypothetical protein [unclassified Blastococcus]
MTTGADWLDQARRLFDVVRASAERPAAASGDGHGGDCRWCPVCQAAAVVRGERPEVTAALADVLTTTAAALRAFAEDQGAGGATSATGDRAPEQPPEQPTEQSTGQPAVQRIDIA